MKVLIAALFIVGAFSFTMQNMNKVTMTHINELQKSTLGKTMLQMIELHALAGNVVDDLIAGIEELIVDLNEELQELEFNYGVRTNEHNALVVQYEQDIDDANIDIQRADDALENLLKPRRSQLRARIDALIENQQANRKQLAEVNLVREQEHEEYNLRMEELSAATDAVDEALALLASLTNPPSLLQVRRINKALEKIESKIKAHTEQATLIKALIVLAQQNFSDQGVVGQIVEKLNEFRNQIVDAQNAATAAEADAVVEYEERVQQLELEYAEFQRQINECTTDLDAVQNKIDELLQWILQRTNDRKQYEAQLQLENETFAQETQIYQDLKAEYLRELAISEQALSMVEGLDFSNIHV